MPGVKKLSLTIYVANPYNRSDRTEKVEWERLQAL
jgi:hypothetical protein